MTSRSHTTLGSTGKGNTTTRARNGRSQVQRGGTERRGVLTAAYFAGETGADSCTNTHRSWRNRTPEGWLGSGDSGSNERAGGPTLMGRKKRTTERHGRRGGKGWDVCVCVCARARVRAYVKRKCSLREKDRRFSSLCELKCSLLRLSNLFQALNICALTT